MSSRRSSSIPNCYCPLGRPNINTRFPGYPLFTFRLVGFSRQPRPSESVHRSSASINKWVIHNDANTVRHRYTFHIFVLELKYSGKYTTHTITDSKKLACPHRPSSHPLTHAQNSLGLPRYALSKQRMLLSLAPQTGFYIPTTAWLRSRQAKLRRHNLQNDSVLQRVK